MMAYYNRYSDEVIKTVKEKVNGTTNEQLAIIVNNLCGTSFDEKKMKSFLVNHHITREVKGKREYKSKLFPDQIADYIEKNHKGVGPKEMAQRLNDTFGTSYSRQQLKAFYQLKKLNSGLDGKFQKGHAPTWHPPKGYRFSPETEFKKGQTSWAVPVGTRSKADGYWKIKIADPNKWEFCHKLAWIQAYGEIPEGHLVTFLDGNSDNYQIDNLALITKGEHAVMNHSHLRFSDPELTRVGINIAKLKKAIKDKNERSKTRKSCKK